MDSQGTVVVRLSTSSALIPLQGATVTITKTRPDGTQELLAVRVTNFDGLTAPVMVETPPMAESRAIRTHPSPMLRSTSASNAQALTGYLSKTRRFFLNTETRQELSLIPTPDLPSSFDRTETFVVPPQSLS